jgi:hypothetical protein
VTARDPDGGARRDADAAPAEDAREALARAGRHARAALRESLEALRALLDAAALAGTGVDARASRMLGPIARLVDDAAQRLGEGGEGAAPLLESIADALDAEIARWEARASDDPEARAVLRAFIGVRELLWEFGVRRSAPGRAGDGAARRAARPRASRRGGPRVQRVPVEG